MATRNKRIREILLCMCLSCISAVVITLVLKLISNECIETGVHFGERTVRQPCESTYKYSGKQFHREVGCATAITTCTGHV